ncbi:hypothetical protein GA0061102_100799 [Rhizobium miluonense]|uniref:Uncharacterized protein n=1 Tax=Rhizobium miluonense TaxID=411945 RepID=A0A1C3V0H5_9HYPH|nr:hypothetical protein GA0061102_100799 [Rhizobium miluonense]
MLPKRPCDNWDMVSVRIRRVPFQRTRNAAEESRLESIDATGNFRLTIDEMSEIARLAAPRAELQTHPASLQLKTETGSCSLIAIVALK